MVILIPMQRLQAFKYELMPTGEQQRDMRRFVMNVGDLANREARHAYLQAVTGRRKRNSAVSNVVSRNTPIWSARSIF